MTLTNAPARETGERLAAARVEGLSKVYGSGETEVVALDDVTLDLYARRVHRDHGHVRARASRP